MKKIHSSHYSIIICQLQNIELIQIFIADDIYRGEQEDSLESWRTRNAWRRADTSSGTLDIVLVWSADVILPLHRGQCQH